MDLSESALNEYVAGFGRILVRKFDDGDEGRQIHGLVSAISAIEGWAYPCNVLCEEFDGQWMARNVLKSEFIYEESEVFRSALEEKITGLYALLGEGAKCYSMESTPEEDDPTENDPGYVDNTRKLKHLMIFRKSDDLILWTFMDMT